MTNMYIADLISNIQKILKLLNFKLSVKLILQSMIIKYTMYIANIISNFQKSHELIILLFFFFIFTFFISICFMPSFSIIFNF